MVVTMIGRAMDADAFEYQGHFSGRYLHGILGSGLKKRLGNSEGTAFQAACTKPEPRGIPYQDFHAIARAPDENEDITSIGIMLELMLDQSGQRIEALAHIGGGASDEDAATCFEAEHGLGFATKGADH